MSKPQILLFSYWFFMQIGWTAFTACSGSDYADTSELRFGSVHTFRIRFGSVQNLYLELETRPLTEPFRIHQYTRLHYGLSCYTPYNLCMMRYSDIPFTEYPPPPPPKKNLRDFSFIIIPDFRSLPGVNCKVCHLSFS